MNDAARLATVVQVLLTTGKFVRQPLGIEAEQMQKRADDEVFELGGASPPRLPQGIPRYRHDAADDHDDL